MLWGDDGFDDGCEVVHIWESFYAKDDIVEGYLAELGSLFWRSDNFGRSARLQC